MGHIFVSAMSGAAMYTVHRRKTTSRTDVVQHYQSLLKQIGDANQVCLALAVAGFVEHDAQRVAILVNVHVIVTLARSAVYPLRWTLDYRNCPACDQPHT